MRGYYEAIIARQTAGGAMRRETENEVPISYKKEDIDNLQLFLGENVKVDHGKFDKLETSEIADYISDKVFESVDVDFTDPLVNELKNKPYGDQVLTICSGFKVEKRKRSLSKSKIWCWWRWGSSLNYQLTKGS